MPTIHPFIPKNTTQEDTEAQFRYLEERNKINQSIHPQYLAMSGQSITQFDHLPKDVLAAVRLLNEYFTAQNIAVWELGSVCSRNFADKVRVYERYFEFKKLNGIVDKKISSIHPSVSDKEEIK